jgi:hypothetical protein
VRAPEPDQPTRDASGGEPDPLLIEDVPRRTRPRGWPPLMQLVVFILAGAMVIGGALGVILRSHPVHCALSLILTLFGIAVLFVPRTPSSSPSCR